MSTSWPSLTFVLLLSGCTWFDGLSLAEQREDESATPHHGDRQDAGHAFGPDVLDSAIDGATDGATDVLDGMIDEPPSVPDGTTDGGVESGAPLPGDPDLPPLEADLTWHPEARRVAVTDDGPWPGVQARVWMLVHGGSTPHRLVSRHLENARDTWLDTGVYDITSDPDAVSFMEGDDQYQRVFFARDGALNMYRYDSSPLPVDDGGVSDPLQLIEAPAGYSIAGGDVAAVTFMDNGKRRIAVAAAALKSDEPGHYCVFEHELDTLAWSSACSEQVRVNASTDIVGVVLGSEVRFFFRGADLGLGELARLPDGSYESRTLATPEKRPIGASLVAMPSETVGRIEIITVSDDGRVFNARIDPGADAVPSWTAVVEDTQQGFVGSTGRAALAAMVSDSRGPDGSLAFTGLFALGQDGQLYAISTNEKDSTRPWKGDWFPVPPAGRDLQVRAIGGITSYDGVLAPGYFFMFPSAISILGGARATTLQEAFWVFANVAFFDHVRPQTLVEAASGGAEVSVASGADHAIAAATLRSSAAPARLQLAASIDGAASWQSFMVKPLAAVDDIDVPASALNPSTAYANKLVHLVDLEWDLPADCSKPSERSRRIVYRRGSDARAIAKLRAGDDGLFVVAADGPYSTPVLAVADTDPGPAVHVLFNELRRSRGGADASSPQPSVVHYWKLSSKGTTAPLSIALLPNLFPVGWLDLVVGELGSQIFAVTASERDMRICNVKAFEGAQGGDPTVAACNFVAPNELAIKSTTISFGAPQPERTGLCSSIDGVAYRCFRDEKPFSIAASHQRANVLYVAYTGEDESGASAVFMTKSDGVNGLGEWSTPVRVSPRNPGDTRAFFDAEITVDTADTVFITYSAIAPAPASEDSTVHVYLAYSKGASASFETAELGTWDAAKLAYDCVSQRWALGDYRRADTTGGRSLHALRHDEGDSLVHVTRWLADYARP